MRPQKCWLLLVFLATITSISLGPPTVARGDDLQDKIQQKAEADTKQAAMRGQLGQLENSITANESRLAATQSDLEQARNRLVTAQAEVDHADADLKVVEAHLMQVQAELAHRQRLLSTRVRVLSEGGEMNYVDILFGSTSLADFIDRLHTLQLLITQDAGLFRGVRAARAEVTAQQVQAAQHKAQVETLAQEARRQQQSIQEQFNQAQALQNKLAADRAQLQSAIDQEAQKAQDISAEIDALQRQANRHHQGKLSLQYPVTPVTITDPFGPRWHPILHTRAFHYGTDFAADQGQPVHAAESGVVIQAGDNGAYGYSVTIDHGDGISTLYGHNSVLKVREGDAVSQGQVIALAGSTGWSTGPHVHFEVRVNGTPQDPMTWLP